MAYEIPGFSFTLPSGADFKTAGVQFRLVAMNASGQAVLPTLGGLVVGVRYTRAAVGQAVTIVNSGIAMIESGDAAVVAGSLLSAMTTGQVHIAAAGEYVIGQALEASAATGVVIAVLLGTRAKA
jgi:predicted RecA/RadA family phage recombinase